MSSELDTRNPAAGIAPVSFDEFYRAQRKSLIAVAYAVTGSLASAEDLAQDALIAAFRSWDRVSQKDNPGTWVRRILLNKASSAHRRRIAEAKALARRPPDLAAIEGPEVTGEVDEIWRQIRLLPRRQLEVVVLTHLEGMSQVEIAAVLRIRKQTVAVHLKRARQTLAERLGLEDRT